jgi:hypothetical protein
VSGLPKQLLVFVGAMLAVSAFLIWNGLERQDSRGTLIAIGGAVALLSTVSFVGLVIVRSRQNIVPVDDSRLLAGLGTWRNSRGNVILLALAAALWGYYLVAAVARGAFGFVALDALLFALCVWGLVRVLRRRRGGHT